MSDPFLLGIVFVGPVVLGVLVIACLVEYDRKTSGSRQSSTRGDSAPGQIRPSATQYEFLKTIPDNSVFAPEAIEQESIEPVAVDPDAAQIGDTITYAFLDDPSREIAITLTENQYVAAKGILPRHHPLSETFLHVVDRRGVRAGDELVIPAGGRLREAVVIRIVKPQS